MKRIFPSASPSALLLSIALSILALPSLAQSNFYKLSIGGGGGITQSFTEVKEHAFGIGGYGSLDYMFTPFISIGLEAQMGQINGGDYKTDPGNKQFTNSYKAVSANGKIYLGSIIDNDYSSLYNNIKGIYIAGGIGKMKNDVTYVIPLEIDNTTYFVQRPSTLSSVFFPVDLGVNFYFADAQGFYRYALNINYQANILLNEYMDGYDDSKVTFKGGNPDIYTFLSVGLKYNFGPIGLSRKNFRKY